ncbi:cyclin-like protein interacting with PHO85 [Elasticomyces elasticus]|nr:cyclin-like protein interacting with PHO85 [Elasticomyces elasticus]KAK3660966.1 cyclin-like protein interacting with PHO85 [Elasticomyces elasticus]KAK4932373.1 cyclin-like protein interacting with PHO85 [Elasticomyces elasticus]KAK4952079.1 cyclin-like protein interacting with PHO85 [Elasticomyces elasticus]KAK4970291.1 cyclin-like protein interacting with PHO85 [Elasticomyces elasticus]
MGSVVLDGINSFFGHSHSHPNYAYPDAPRAQHASPQPRHSRTSSRAERPMSASGQRAPSSSDAQTTQHAPIAHNATRASSQASQRSAPPPPSSPRLGGNAVPPQLASQQPPTSADNAPASVSSSDTRPDRPQKIKVRDLQHIQSFASEDMGAFSEVGSRSRSRSRGGDIEGPQYEISDMKVEHIIEMVAGLLTKITTTNDQQHEHLHRQPAHLEHAPHLTPQTSSVLAFHGKNVPSITILSYLSRINKYCPTSYEVFLSLLVYFDRMTERVNAGPMQSLREANQQAFEQNGSGSSSTESLAADKMEDVTSNAPQTAQTATPPPSGSMETAVQQNTPGTPHSRPQQHDSPGIPAEPSLLDTPNLSHFFVVDSFNIHRLVIAGVTCASKFFSDIFYTNSRYAKVGGLPLQELNHLELQFLLLNDFRLSIPVEEIEAYGTMLVEFYAREVVAQRRAAEAMTTRSLSESSGESTATITAAE